MTVSFLQEMSTHIPATLREKATSLDSKAFAFDLLAKISIVAAIAIGAAFLYASIGVVTSPLLTAGLPVCLIPLGFIHQFLSQKAEQLQKQTCLYKKIVSKLEEGTSPLRALLAVYREQLRDLRTLPRPRSTNIVIDCYEEEKAQIRLQEEIVPCAIRIAIISKFLHQPSKIDIDPFSLSFPGVGTCKPRPYKLHLHGRSENCQPRNDDYFVFEENRHPTLTLEQIEMHLAHPENLQTLLFP